MLKRPIGSKEKLIFRLYVHFNGAHHTMKFAATNTGFKLENV